MFRKTFVIEGANFLSQNEGGTKSLLCKNIDAKLLGSWHLYEI